MRPQGKGVYEECAPGLGFMVIKPHPVAMIQTPGGVYVLVNVQCRGVYDSKPPDYEGVSPRGRCGLLS